MSTDPNGSPIPAASAPGTPDLGIVLTSGGVTLVLDLRGGRLPVVLHWGAELGPLDGDAFAAMATGIRLPSAAESVVDASDPVTMLPAGTDGWAGRPGISGSRDGAAWSPEFTTARVVLDGAALTSPGLHSTGAGLLLVEALDEEAALALALTVELTPAGVVRTRAELRNLGGDVYQLDELSLSLPVPLDADEVLDFAGRWGAERAPQRHRAVIGQHRRENRRGRTGLGSAYLLCAGFAGFGFGHGRLWGVHTAWSGNHVHEVERTTDGVQLLRGGELLLPGEVRLGPGESYRTPWVLGFHGVGLDALAAQSHSLLRARPGYPRRPRPVTLNVWEAVYFAQDLPSLIALADVAAEVGIERFVVDDGWFGARRNDRAGLGDWTVSPDVWPDGLHPLIDHVHARGMEFGLWVEPEMVNPDSDLARAHPEWILRARDRMPLPARNQQVLDLSNPTCFAHIDAALRALLAEYPIRYLKWDHNRDLVDAGVGEGPGHARVPGVHAQTEAVYRLMAGLKRDHPELEIESCSSGGGRIDHGVLDIADRVWVSDDNDPLERLRINRWTAQLVPAELMGTHIASPSSHTTGRTHSLAFRAAVALFGHLGVEWDIRSCSAEERAELASWIRLHKDLRKLIRSGRLVRSDTADPRIAVQGVVSEDGARAMYLFAQTAILDTSTVGRITLPGLDPQARYLVTVLDPGGEIRPGHQAPWQGLARPVFPGDVLAHAGLVMPSLRPERAVLIDVRAEA